jgi:hypothetical protein
MKNLFTSKLVMILSILLLSGCFEPTGKVRIRTDINDAELFIDGELKAPIGKDFIELELVASEHKIEVKSLSENEEWRYYGSENVTIIENVTIETKISTSSSETQKRIKRIAHERKEREASKLAKKVETEFRRRLQEQGVL